MASTKTLKRIVVRTRWEFKDADIKFTPDAAGMKEARRIRDWINSGASEFAQCAKIIKVFARATNSSLRTVCGCGDSFCSDCAGG